MSQEIVKFDVDSLIPLENSSDVNEEFQNEYYPDNKIYVSETAITDTINISNNEYVKNDRIRKYEMVTADHIKTDIRSSEVYDIVSNNVKIEDGICPADVEIKLCNELQFCNHCHEVYQDYCTKCRVLVYILNERSCHNTYNGIRELPKYMLETRESIGHLGIFSLKVIPEDVKFGPFTGLNSTRLSLRIKGGRIVVSDDKLEHLNWMQYINPARNICEQNLFPFQYEDKLYYCSTRRIQKGEELLVYFGKEYEDNLLKNAEMDFTSITKKDFENVFACIFCCLGFRSKEYLAEHKAVCHSESNEIFSLEELTQCPFCKMYIETKEYLEHHKDYCCETNDRRCSPEIHDLDVERRSSERHKAKTLKCRIYKCTQCKFKTMYNADFRNHTNEHYKVKMYKCGICDRRYKAKESLQAHMEKINAKNEGRDLQTYTTWDYFKANIKNIRERSPQPHDDEKQYQCTKCKFQTRDECHLKSHINIKHLNRGKYKCAYCEFKTYYRTYLERHMKIEHLMESSYKCAECDFETNYRSNLQVHKNAKHLKASDYKCADCEFKTYYKSNLDKHIKARHLKETAFKCAECEYKTYYKSDLEKHIKARHLKLRDYKCIECEYQTNDKRNFKMHIKTRHLKERDYKCTECEYKTNYKSSLETHVRTKHLKECDYKCLECEYQTNGKRNLKIHVKTRHLKENYYKCAECEFKTYCKSRLKVHLKTKHSNERDFKCMRCEYQTNYKSCLEKHMKAKHLNQNDYKCMECDYKTNYKSDLEKHVKSKHLNQKDYKCEECGYKTGYKSNLERHVKAKHEV